MAEKDPKQSTAEMVAFLAVVAVLAGYVLIFTLPEVHAPVPTAALYTIALCVLGIAIALWSAK